MKKRVWANSAWERVVAWGVWWLNVQKLETTQLGVFWGFKIWRLAFYVRYSAPDRS